MENLFLRVFTVSAAVSILLLPLFLCRRQMEKRYSPRTRWGLWLAVALVLLTGPWLPKSQAPVVVKAPTYTVPLPAAPKDRAVVPAEKQTQTEATLGSQTKPAGSAQSETPGQTNQATIPAAPQFASSQRSSVSVTALFSGVWLSGLSLVLLWQSGWYLLARRRLLRASTPVTGLESYAAELGLEGRVTFYHCKAVPSPMTLGMWKPAVLLPAGGLAVAALRHELYHVKRRDVAYKFLLLCVCALHWFNPLVWFMYRLADRDVEACCDAAVVEGQDGGYKRSYGELLLTTAAGLQSLPFTTSFGGGAEQMRARLAQLFHPGKQSCALVCFVLVLAVALCSLVACQQTAEKPTPDSSFHANMSWPAGDGVEAGLMAAQPLTENSMPTLVYYDPNRDFLLYRTADTAYLHYGDSWTAYRPSQSEGRRVLWRCDVSEDENTVYLSDVFDDSTGRDERFYEWDIERRKLTTVDAIPDGVDHMTHVGSEELFYSGFMNGTSLKSNVIKTQDGTLAGLYIDELLGNTIEYLQLARMREDGTYEAEGSAMRVNAFLTPERIPAPQTYTDPAWGFTLQLPKSLEGNYVVSRAANNWNFYNKELYPLSGYLFSLWAEDSARQQEIIDGYNGPWPGKILGEKNGITYTLTAWTEDYLSPEELDSVRHMTMLRDVWDMSDDALELTAVTRSSGYLWPLPYIDYGSDVIFGEEDNALRIQASEEVSVQSIAGGRVVRVSAHPVTGDMSVTVAHPEGRYSEYSHLEYVQVEEGDSVERSGVIGFARQESGLCWLTFRVLEGPSWDAAVPIDPWSVEYRTYDFQPVTRDSLVIAGNPEITAAMRAVLRGEATFYNVETGEYCYADALAYSDDIPVKVYRFTQLDMDGDTVPETVLWLQRGEDIYQLGSIILRYQNGWIYGYPMGYRSMILETLKADGAYSWSGGAPNNGWGRKDFLRNETVDVIWHDYDMFYVNGSSVTEEAYNQALKEQEAKPDVDWYDFTKGNIAMVH